NFKGFDPPGPAVWKIDATETEKIIYPFPQFVANQTDPGYPGDTILADQTDYRFNATLNKAITSKLQPSDRMDAKALHRQEAVPSTISYQEAKSEYAIQIDSYDKDAKYQVRVYDGDAAETTKYAPTLVRSYEITGGTITGGGKLQGSKSVSALPPTEQMQFFDRANVTLSERGKLTIGNKEEIGYYMPIHGYYTVVVTKDTGIRTARAKPTLLEKVKNFFVEDRSIMGVKSGKLAVSQRFQIHFGGNESGGSNIQANSGTYTYGTAGKPYLVTDNYGIIGLTTSGIAKEATKGRYYKQSKDITIDEKEPFYSIFEFNGVYDGGKRTLTRRDGDAGFISLLRTVTTRKPIPAGNFVAGVSNLTMDVQAVGTQPMSHIGKYLEATDYVGNLGLITDYMEVADIKDVTIKGHVQPDAYENKPGLENGYLDSGHILAGVAAVVKDGSNIINTKNEAQIGVALKDQVDTINLGNGKTVTVTTQIPNSNMPVEVAGIAGYVHGGFTKLINVSNNGNINASGNRRHAAGLVHTMNANASLTKGANGGWIRTENGIAAGLVLEQTDSRVTQSYNSGKITGYALGSGTGTAIGCVADINGGSAATDIYNAGMISGKQQAAISRTKGKTTNAFYLKDEKAYWGDSTALPQMDITKPEDVQLYMGVGCKPTEIFGYLGDTTKDGAVGYEAFTSTKATGSIAGKLGGFGTTWMINEPPKENPTQNKDNLLIRDYAQDYYPLPQFIEVGDDGVTKEGAHGQRKNLNFPLFFGMAQEAAKTPYGTNGKVKYVPEKAMAMSTTPPEYSQAPLQVPSASEVFLDTIAVDLKNMQSTDKYEVLVFEGDPGLTSGVVTEEAKKPAKIKVTVERKYVDLRNPGALPDISNVNNLQYSDIITSHGSAYYYEVGATADGEAVSAVFANKNFTPAGTNEILLNNNLLDALPEANKTGATYYSATRVEYEIPGKPLTDENNYYAKFSPHFANATETQTGLWNFGSTGRPYEIATQRHLANISKGGRISPGIPEADASHYLQSNFKQTQSVKRTDAKAVVPAIRKLEGENQPKLWNANRPIGTDKLDFSGTYTAKAGADTRYNIEDGLSDQYRGALFNGLSKSAKVEELNYVFTKATGSTESKALIAQKSAGMVNNIHVDANVPTTFTNRKTTEPFGLIVGTLNNSEKASATTAPPEVRDIDISEKISLNTDVDRKQAFAVVIGSINGVAKVSKVDARANINSTGLSPGSVGGIIGKVDVDAFSPNDKEDNINVTVENEIFYRGKIGKIAHSDNQKIGGIIGSVNGGTKAGTRTIALKDITKQNIIHLDAPSMETSAGGVVGYIQGTDVVMDNMSVDGAMTAQKGRGPNLGGVIGKLDQVKMTDIKDVTVKSGTMNYRRQDSAFTDPLYAGGIIGRADSNIPDSAITLNSVKNQQTMDVSNIGDQNAVGGIIGSATGYKLDFTGTESIGNITMANQTATQNTVGGIVGIAQKTDDIQFTDVTAGAVGTTISVVGSGGNQQETIGGLIGKAIPKTAGAKIILKGTKNHNHITTTNVASDSAIGGLIGQSKGYVLDFSKTENTGNVSMENNLVLSTRNANAGGLIGYTEGQNVTIADSTMTGKVSSNLVGDKSRGGDSHVGGLIGQTKEIPKLVVNSTKVGTGDPTADAGKLISATGTVNDHNVPKDTLHVGGVVGKITTTTTVDTSNVEIKNTNNYLAAEAIQAGEQSTLGGMIGLVQNYGVDIQESKHIAGIKMQGKSVTTGGIIGEIADGQNITLLGVESGKVDDKGVPTTTMESNHWLEDNVERPLTVTAGGIIGKATGAGVAIGEPIKTMTLGSDKSSVKNNSNMTFTNVAATSQIGGIIGNVEGYAVHMTNTQNLGTITVNNIGDESSLDIGGLVAKVKKSEITLEDTLGSKDTNLYNTGGINLNVATQNAVTPESNKKFAAGTLHIAGGIGYMEDSKAAVTGFKNTGNMSVGSLQTTPVDPAHPAKDGNQDMNLYLAGTIGVASGISDSPGNDVVVTKSLNAGNLLDNRTQLKEADQTAHGRALGISKVAGMIAETSTEKIVSGAANGSGVIVNYNHNAGALRGIQTAGIIHTIVGDQSISNSSVKYNMNIAPIDAAPGDVKTGQNGFNITGTWQLPVSVDELTNEYNGKGEVIDDGTITPLPPDTEPVIVKHYNIGLENMVQPVPIQDPDPAAEKITKDSIALSLGQMQNLGEIQGKAGWPAQEIAMETGAVAPDTDNSQWMMQAEQPDDYTGTDREFLLPVIRENAYVPTEEVNFTEKAAYDITTTIVADGYEVHWTYEDTIDTTKDGFGLIIKSADGATARILQLQPGVATADASVEGVPPGYHFTMKPEYLAKITEELTDATEYTVTVAAIRENGRLASSLATGTVILEPTKDVEDVDLTKETLVIEPPKPIVRLGMSGAVYSSDIGRAVVEYAFTRLGDPYSMPLAGQGSYLDCSYLVMASYRSVGINLPRTAAEQARYCVDNGYTISKEELMPGDLIFYSYQPSERFMSIGHVAIYAGDGMIVEAGSSQGMVVYGPSHSPNQQVLYARPYRYAAGAETNNNGASIKGNSSDELYLLAQIIGLEAGDENRDGMIATAEVIRNRMLSGKFPNTISGVVSQQGQFQPYYMVDSYTPNEEQLQIARDVMESGLSILNNPNCLYFCSRDYYDAKGIYGFWGRMQMIAEYGDCFFVQS
ncbi:MAG: NlpC/P60 family protein, partial [Lachnospiraceae bacterium]